ncbi:unnamed protein product [Hymenolepis diminuta]|uniref:Eukaryotic translation initiation factor 3 subunit K n=1 Tax=Hymenolepis diminuta TaxID=6216 RepID=A0A0R3SCF0_HYMDI|nr:unnamed protein product [Hymenolepis diminuta]
MPPIDSKEQLHAQLQVNFRFYCFSYNPDHLPELEKHLAWQVTENDYDFEANLIMLYQFCPDLFDVDAARLILLKGITKLPFADFLQYKYLIQTDRLNEEPLSTIVHLETLLETCKFQEFWKTYKENKAVVGNIPDFDISVRSYICYVIDTTYQRISKGLLMSLLDMKAEELPKVIETRRWKLMPKEEGDTEEWISITNHEASVKSTNIKEKVTFEAMARSAQAFKPSVGHFFIQVPKKLRSKKM